MRKITLKLLRKMILKMKMDGGIPTIFVFRKKELRQFVKDVVTEKGNFVFNQPSLKIDYRTRKKPVMYIEGLGVWINERILDNNVYLLDTNTFYTKNPVTGKSEKIVVFPSDIGNIA